MSDHDSDQLDAHDAMKILTETRTQTGRALEVNGAILYGAWGIAWLGGYLAIWSSTRGAAAYQAPATWSLVVLGVLMLGALLATGVTIGRAVHGVTGISSKTGSLYGWAWLIAFAGFYALLGGLAKIGVSDQVLGLFTGAAPALIVATIYAVSGALWRDGTMFAMGAWLTLVTAVGVAFGPVTFALILAIAGGGGFLVAAGFDARRRRA